MKGLGGRMAIYNLAPNISNQATFSTQFVTNQKNVIGNMGVVNATSNNYNDLNNKPSINGVILIGNLTSESLGIIGDKNFVFNQNVASDLWEINHNLNIFPSVTVVDSGNNIVIGEVTYINENSLQIIFTSPFSGSAYLN